MKIELDHNEIIPLNNFSLNWRWEETHNSMISISEKALIKPVSESESKRLNKVIDYFEVEDNLKKDFNETEWISASCEKVEKIDSFRKTIDSILEPWNENVIITWNRTTTLTTTKEIFLKYWDDFCYPSSDDVTIISEDTNWIMFYDHIEVAKIWTRKKRTHNIL